MINGVDLLFAVIGLIGIFLLWYFGEKYADWMEWNHRRRRQRIRTRMRVYEEFERDQYLRSLRWQFRLHFFTNTMSNIAVATRRATKAMEDFNRQFRDFNTSRQKHPV